jgi:hypothetical protein
VKLVMTLLARDEADIVDAQLAFHLNAGVDFVVATDNRSEDGTLEVFERYERQGLLQLIREPGDDTRQSEWVTRMARLAATELGADWVINSDADEFWWPRGGSLKDVLSAIPERFSVVRGAWRHFLPRPDDDRAFYERMTVRLRTPASPGDKSTIYHAHQKVAHRARADVRVADGNHDVDVPGGVVPLRGWYPLEILHFSFRSRAQFEAKAGWAYPAWARNPAGQPTLHHKLAYDAVRSGSADEFYGHLVVDDEALELGLDNGTLELDTRLRDALRRLRSDDGTFDAPERGAVRALLSSAASLADAVSYVDELAPLVEIDGIVRAENRVDAIENRVAMLARSGVRSVLPALAARAVRVTSGRRLPPR